jgi:hypothetical protein
MNIVQDDQLIIARRDNILFEIIGAHFISQGFGLERVFG